MHPYSKAIVLKVVCPLTELRNPRDGFGAMNDFEKFFEDMPSDSLSAVIGWTKWFQTAKESKIPALVRFAVQKEKRLPGLAARAIHPISTGKLEGFNNKIKVAKRIGYGYRDDDFFFTSIRYLSIPYVRSPSHKKS